MKSRRASGSSKVCAEIVSGSGEVGISMMRTGGGMADALLWEECKRNIEIKENVLVFCRLEGF